MPSTVPARRPASMSRVDAPEGAVPHGRFVPSEWVAARRPEHIDSHGAPLVPGTGRKWHERFVVFPREVVTLPILTAVPDGLAGGDGSPLYDGDEVIVVPCTKRHRKYPIHTATIDYFHGFHDDGIFELDIIEKIVISCSFALGTTAEGVGSNKGGEVKR